MTKITFGSDTEFDPGEGQLSLDGVPAPIRSRHKVRHKITGWSGTVKSVNRKRIPKVTVTWDKGGESTIPLDSVERV